MATRNAIRIMDWRGIVYVCKCDASWWLYIVNTLSRIVFDGNARGRRDCQQFANFPLWIPPAPQLFPTLCLTTLWRTATFYAKFNRPSPFPSAIRAPTPTLHLTNPQALCHNHALTHRHRATTSLWRVKNYEENYFCARVFLQSISRNRARCARNSLVGVFSMYIVFFFWLLLLLVLGRREKNLGIAIQFRYLVQGVPAERRIQLYNNIYVSTINDIL